ncbi:hypothetical protein MNBD_NITROSPINAE04-2161 [hydrothermal vent metagenome]|uniref:Uncharacterized protein n=1 Tax=hydrothermal vent metagenome TaxID=652676 RepID=A0A3B1CIY5_9ZZZZ
MKYSVSLAVTTLIIMISAPSSWGEEMARVAMTSGQIETVKHVASKGPRINTEAMLPIASGVVMADGTIRTATANVSVKVTNGPYYMLSVDKVDFSSDEYVTVITSMGRNSYTIAGHSDNKELMVTWYRSGAATDGGFQFVTYKVK